MKKSGLFFGRIAAVVGILACAGDLFMTGYFGNKYPGYDQIRDTMSKLGASDSPVGVQMSAWWVALCFLFLVFALGFRTAFAHKQKTFQWGFWLIVIYALGEGMGSGIFPADHIHNKISMSLMIHDSLGGIGIAGIMILPFILLKPLSAEFGRLFYRFTLFILIFGPLMLILFSIAKIGDNPNNFIVALKGLWQRLLMLNYYAYIIFLAFITWKELDKHTIVGLKEQE